MSDEPRIRLEDSGTVVSEYWYDQSTGETVVESESGETYRFANDGTLDTPALNTDELNNVYYAANFDGADGGAKIQNALDTANSTAGKNAVVLTPKGPDNPDSAPESDVWKVSKHIDVQGYNHTDLIGLGRPLVWLADGAADDILRTASDDSGPTTIDFNIRGIRFDGNKTGNSDWIQGGGKFGDDPSGGDTQTIKGLVGVRLVDVENCAVEDCEFRNCARFGIQHKLYHNCRVENCEGSNCGDDAFTATNEYFNSQDADNLVYEDIKGTGCSDQGIEIEDGAQSVTIKNGWFENNQNSGATVKSHDDEQPCNNVTWINCDFVNNTGSGLAIRGSPFEVARNHNVINCRTRGNTKHGIDIADPNDINQGINDISIENTEIVIDGEQRGVSISGNVVIEGLSIDIDIDVADGSNLLRGIRIFEAEIDGLEISANVRASEGIYIATNSGPITNLTIHDDTHVEGVNGSGLVLRTQNGNELSRGTIGGTYKNNGQNGSGEFASGIRLEDGASTMTDLTFNGVHAYDDQGTTTQDYGIWQDGDYHIYDSCNLRGNGTGAFGGTQGTNSVKGNNIV